MEQILYLQDLQQDSQALDTEYALNLHIPNVSIDRTYSPAVVYNDQAFTEFVNGEDIPSTFSNVSHVSAKVKESTHIKLPIHISTEDNNTLHTQISGPALGFTLVEVRHTQTEPKLTVQQLLEI